MNRTVIFITMREEHHSDFDETRNALDKRWVELLWGAGYLAILIPNNPLTARLMAEQFSFSGVILTGGNTIASLGGDAPSRDETEKVLLDIAIERNIPVLGVCRGFQFILDYFDEQLVQISNHVNIRHTVTSYGSCKFAQYIDSLKNVNSYHQFSAQKLQNLKVMATSSDNYIEAACHDTLPIYGIMWHPERDAEQTIQSRDFLKHIFS